MMPVRRALAAVAVALGVTAATPAPPPAVDRPAGFRSSGTLVVRATISGSPLAVGGNIALAQRGNVYRLDVLSLAFPGTDPTAGSVAGALLAPGGATALYDGTNGTLTVYSTGNGVYYQNAPAAPPAAPNGPIPVPIRVGAADPLAALAAVARQLHDVKTAAIQLVGHSTVNGHPSDDLDVLVRRQRAGKPLEDYHAQLSLAEDLDGFPVRIALSSTPPTSADTGGSLRLDLTSVSRDVPDPSMFILPPGLARVTSIGEVLQAKH